MAKVIKNGESIECEVLYENAGQYIVKFKTGVVRGIDKNRVYDFDRIDEGVLDTIRNTANKYGKKVISAAKDAAERVKKFFISFFTIDNFVFFKNSNNKVLSVSHPINAIEGAKMSGCVNFVPGSGVVEMCNIVGIKPEAVENFTYDSKYTGAIQFTEIVDESCCESNSLLTALFEDAKRRLKPEDRIDLHGKFADTSQEEIVDIIVNEHYTRFNNIEPNILPLFIWGAPGIGKTSIIRSVNDKCKKYTGEDINIISISGGSVGPDDFTMPATITKEGSTVIQDLPKTWLPVYDSMSPDAEKLRFLANGGHVDPSTGETINGPGGIFFIDEFSRLSQSAMHALMQTPSTREIGTSSSLKLGDRWVIVCAGNRASDMSRRGMSELVSFEPATKTRFNHVNFVPNPKDWMEWANSPSKKWQGRNNILSEIVSYIHSEYRNYPDTFGDFYEMYNHRNGELNGEYATACPRTWEALSDYLIIKYLKCYDETKRKNSISDIGIQELSDAAAGIVGRDVADRFAHYVSRFSMFKEQDAENVWRKGANCTYDMLKNNKIDSSNIQSIFKNRIFPLLKETCPRDEKTGKVIPDAVRNFVSFLELCCRSYGVEIDPNFIDLTRFKEISSAFGDIFGRDTLDGTNNVYADAANLKFKILNDNDVTL